MCGNESKQDKRTDSGHPTNDQRDGKPRPGQGVRKCRALHEMRISVPRDRKHPRDEEEFRKARV